MPPRGVKRDTTKRDTMLVAGRPFVPASPPMQNPVSAGPILPLRWFPIIGNFRRRIFQSLEILILGGALTACATMPQMHSSLPRAPEFGVNIHFTKQIPGELAMIQRAGFTWVRMDFHWAAIEREKGKYDFSAYDGLVADLEKNGLKAYFIFDYGNHNYDKGESPFTDEGRAAFARWAAASVNHFAGRGYIWETWNEPNIGFWKPTPNVTNYAALALATAKAVREAAPGEALVGPATSLIDFKFIEPCFQAGLLNFWDAVSVHPYRQQAPGNVTNEYTKLRAMIAKYAPPGRVIPILAGEWGYSAAWKNYDEAKQAERVTQEFTVNRAEKIPVTIWYDWHDDGTDPKEPEHHFGLVSHAKTGDEKQPYKPKPAYEAAMKFLRNDQ